MNPDYGDLEEGLTDLLQGALALQRLFTELQKEKPTDHDCYSPEQILGTFLDLCRRGVFNERDKALLIGYSQLATALADESATLLDPELNGHNGTGVDVEDS